MRKPIISVIICISILFCSAAFAADDEIAVIINGERLGTPIAPQIVNDRTMLPMRSIFESLGAKVSWFEADQIIFATKDDTLITLKIGVSEMSIQKIGDGNNISVALDSAPYIDSDYTLVPVRAVAEALDAQVGWIAESRTVVISKE